MPRSLLPEVRFFGYHESRCASPWFPHVHQTLLEIHYLEAGMVPTWFDDEVVQLSGGQVFVVPPHHVHGGRYRVLGPCRLYWLGLEFPPIDETSPAGTARGLLGLTESEAVELGRALRRASARALAASEDLVTAFRALRRLLPGRESLMAAVEIRARVLTVMVQCVRANERRTTAHGALVNKALEAIESRLGSPETIEALSRRLGCSRQHLQEAFRAQMGVGPGDYWLYRRIMQSCRLLETTDLGVAQIAQRLGFGSSQYFGTAFKRLMGTPPLGFRRRELLDAALAEPGRTIVYLSPSRASVQEGRPDHFEPPQLQ